MTIRKWIAKNLLGVEVVEKKVYLPHVQSIDHDDDYRGTGKTTMRMKAAKRHIELNPNGTVMYVCNTNQRAALLRKMYAHMFESDNRITFVGKQSLSARMVRSRPSKWIYDLYPED